MTETERERFEESIAECRAILSRMEPTTRITLKLTIFDVCIIQLACKLSTGAFLRLDRLPVEELQHIFECFEALFPTLSWDDLRHDGLLT